MNAAHLFLVAYQPPEQGGLRELVCWTDNPQHAHKHPDLCADQDLMHEVKCAVDADAQAHFGQAGGDVLRITTLALEGVKIEAIPDTPASAPAWKRTRPAPDLSLPSRELRVFHVIPRAPEQVYQGFRLPEGQEQEGVLCLAPSPHAALVSAWSLAAFDPSHPSPSPCRDLAVWLGGWQRATGLWVARSDHFPTAVLTPQKVSAEEIQRRAAPNAARGILALAFAPS